MKKELLKRSEKPLIGLVLGALLTALIIVLTQSDDTVAADIVTTEFPEIDTSIFYDKNSIPEISNDTLKLKKQGQYQSFFVKAFDLDEGDELYIRLTDPTGEFHLKQCEKYKRNGNSWIKCEIWGRKVPYGNYSFKIEASDGKEIGYKFFGLLIK